MLVRLCNPLIGRGGDSYLIEESPSLVTLRRRHKVMATAWSVQSSNPLDCRLGCGGLQALPRNELFADKVVHKSHVPR